MTGARVEKSPKSFEDALALLDPVGRAAVRLGLMRYHVCRGIDERHAREVIRTKIEHYLAIATINARYAEAMREHLNRCIDERARYGLPPRRLRIRVPALTE